MSDVPDATKWVDELRGGDETEQEPVALESVYEIIIHWDEGGGKRSRRELARRITELYTAPPKPAQDLIVGYADSHDIARAGHDFWVSRQPGKNTVPLYLYGHPPKIWQGLTDEEMLALIAYEPHPLANRTAIINAVERLLKEKNRG